MTHDGDYPTIPVEGRKSLPSMSSLVWQLPACEISNTIHEHLHDPIVRSEEYNGPLQIIKWYCIARSLSFKW